MKINQANTLEASWTETPTQKLLVQSWTGAEKFIKILSFHQKLFNFFSTTDRQKDRQKDR
jgi:hypothetical protein